MVSAVSQFIALHEKRSYGKEMFSQACLKNSVQRGGGCLKHCMLGYTPPGQTPPLGRLPLHPDTATATGGTYLKGIYSCYEKNFNMVFEGRRYKDSASEQSVSHVLMPRELNCLLFNN